MEQERRERQTPAQPLSSPHHSPSSLSSLPHQGLGAEAGEEDWEDWDDYWEDDEGEWDEDEDICPEGFGWDECCGCVLRRGVEHCEFMCPFGGIPRPCYRPECERMVEEEAEKIRRALRDDGE